MTRLQHCHPHTLTHRHRPLRSPRTPSTPPQARMRHRPSQPRASALRVQVPLQQHHRLRPWSAWARALTAQSRFQLFQLRPCHSVRLQCPTPPPHPSPLWRHFLSHPPPPQPPLLGALLLLPLDTLPQRTSRHRERSRRTTTKTTGRSRAAKRKMAKDREHRVINARLQRMSNSQQTLAQAHSHKLAFTSNALELIRSCRCCSVLCQFAFLHHESWWCSSPSMQEEGGCGGDARRACWMTTARGHIQIIESFAHCLFVSCVRVLSTAIRAWLAPMASMSKR